MLWTRKEKKRHELKKKTEQLTPESWRKQKRSKSSGLQVEKRDRDLI